LKEFGEKAQAILRANPNARDVQSDWRRPVQTVRPFFSEDPARRVGVGRQDLAQALEFSFNGIAMGLFREGDVLLPMVARPVEEERARCRASRMSWSGAFGGSLHSELQVASVVETLWGRPLIKRRNRQRAVPCSESCGRTGRNAAAGVKDEIESIMLPPGYSLEWPGSIRFAEAVLR
jgi:multidrug efflux pump subunit AcrB